MENQIKATTHQPRSAEASSQLRIEGKMVTATIGKNDTSDDAAETAIDPTWSHIVDLTGPELIDLTALTKLAETVSTKAASPVKRTKRPRRQDSLEICVGDKKQPAKKRAVARQFDCAICLEEQVERFRGYQLSICLHSFCRECLYGYIQSKLTDKDVRSLRCPAVSCQKPIGAADVRACTKEIGDDASWLLYEELSTEAFLDSAVASAASGTNASTSLRRCPTNHCNFTFEFEPDARGQLFVCPTCESAYCLNCAVVGGKVGPAHDKSCEAVLEEVRQSEERQRKLEEWKKENAAADIRFRELLQREGQSGLTKPCPSCHTPITKNGGCNHMYCTRCGTHFNW